MSKFENNLVSIIMPAYNAQKYISDSITSVLNQTYKNWELIIVDDYSTDNTLAIIEEFKKCDNRIILLRQDQNSGVAAARNKGIEHAKGRFLAFLDSDDIWEKTKLEKQVNFMLKNKIYFSYTSYQLMDENNNLSNKVVKVQNEPIEFEKLLECNYFGCLTVMIDLSKIKKPYFPNIPHEDYALWLDILKNNDIKAYGIDEVLAYYRISPGSVSRNKLKSLKWIWNIYREHLKYGRFYSLFRMCVFLVSIYLKYNKKINSK